MNFRGSTSRRVLGWHFGWREMKFLRGERRWHRPGP